MKINRRRQRETLLEARNMNERRTSVEGISLTRRQPGKRERGSATGRPSSGNDPSRMRFPSRRRMNWPAKTPSGHSGQSTAEVTGRRASPVQITSPRKQKKKRGNNGGGERSSRDTDGGARAHARPPSSSEGTVTQNDRVRITSTVSGRVTRTPVTQMKNQLGFQGRRHLSDPVVEKSRHRRHS